MRKKAVLIGATHSNLFGVNHDFSNLIEFLKSPRGGYWFNSEIETFLDKNIETVESNLERLKETNYDYILMYWSGHGGYDNNNNLLLEIEKNKTINSTSLLNISRNQLTIFDTCRQNAYNPVLEPCMEGLSKFASLNQNDCFKYREFYEKLISSSCKGQQIIYSCLKDECSSATDERGSFFTNSLIIESKNWSLNNNLNSRSIKDIVNDIKSSCKKENQTPDVEGPKCHSDKYYPFVVSL